VKLEGKRVLLSGATGGIGRAIAEELAGRGAKLVLSSRRRKELQELARSLPGGARRHKVVVADLSKAGAAEKLVRDAGDIDVLVANAALPGVGRIEDIGKGELTKTLRVNLEAPILMSRELVPKLEKKGEGHIVFISSLNGKVGTPRTAIYCTTKFGMRGFALALREDLHPKGVGVSVVAPGFIREAGMFHESGTKLPRGVATRTPEDVAKAVLEGIDRNRAEIDVAPFSLSSGAKVFGLSPPVASRISRLLGGDDVSAQLEAGQRDKR